MLAVVIPAVLSWVLLRLRGGPVRKLAALSTCFLVVNAWMGFVIANRSTTSIITAIKEKGFSLTEDAKVHHEGLNMYEELCWISTFIQQGSYSPNWGSRYFADAVNFIPRTIWSGKPLIGIDYAILRGQGAGGEGQAGVWATISTGMIGQGVVNFGRFLGPAAAALLMSLWAAGLARLDLRIHEIGRLPLYAMGLILTFNLGRDITLITLYPFVFGVALVCVLGRSRPESRQRLVRWTRLKGRLSDSRSRQSPPPPDNLPPRRVWPNRPVARRARRTTTTQSVHKAVQAEAVGLNLSGASPHRGVSHP
jgi:hypothetical protein